MSTRRIIGWEHTCERCGNIWQSFKQEPKMCANPKCRSGHWNVESISDEELPSVLSVAPSSLMIPDIITDEKKVWTREEVQAELEQGRRWSKLAPVVRARKITSELRVRNSPEPRQGDEDDGADRGDEVDTEVDGG